jgi:hypothetical protein
MYEMNYTYVLWCKNLDWNVVVHLPLIYNGTSLEIHSVEVVRVIEILENHITILLMQHDLVRVESLAAWCLDVRDGRRELKLILGSVLEDTNLVATYNKRPVVLVANRQLRVLVSVRGASLDVVF